MQTDALLNIKLAVLLFKLQLHKRSNSLEGLPVFLSLSQSSAVSRVARHCFDVCKPIRTASRWREQPLLLFVKKGEMCAGIIGKESNCYFNEK